ncbi:MAG: Mth938-like domain-containing protein [Rhodocyclaceae bacterium]|nr:Mth938-like domain-containing protein [Rhodocyclaceae bacterium]
MKLYADSRSSFHVVTAHGPGYVAVDGQRLERSLLLQPDRIDAAWGPDAFAELTAAHLAPLATLGCDVLLLGTGPRQRFPAPAILRPLIEARVGVEVMDTPAACRTYNILVAEGRQVAAALIVEREAA